MLQKYFSFSGRINRKPYWMFLLSIFICMLIIGGIAGGFYGLGLYPVSVIIVGVGYLALIVASVSFAVRRLHDRDKSGWWLLVFYLVPAILGGIAKYVSGPEPGLNGFGAIFQLASTVISLWGLVEIGFLKGTVGPNRFGPDPLADGQENPNQS